MCQVQEILFFSVIFVFGSSFCDSAKILASVFTPSYSHQVVFRPLWKELDKRGHQVTLITTDPINDSNLKNLKEIDVGMSYKIMESYKHREILSDMNNLFEMKKIYTQALHDTALSQLEHPEVQQLIHNKSENFDLLIIEVAYPTHIGFVERWKVPMIGLVSLDASSTIHEIMGNSIHPVIYPDTFVPFAAPMNFWQRLASFLMSILLYIDGCWNFFPREDETVKKIFGNKSRSIKELLEDLDMLFINVNPLLHRIRATTPNTVMFGGGIHLTPVKPLPTDLQNFLDNATNGVIYVSLGTNVESKSIRGDLRNIFLETFADLPYKVLWKFEVSEDLKNKSDNVMIKKWFPQSDILRHPNMKLFITQCGLQSMEEAIMSHVPMLGLPFFGDQQINGAMMKNKKIGMKLDPMAMTKDMFRNAINEILENDEYKKNIIEIATLLTDVQMTGLEKMVWWTEYVIRNDGAKLFRNPVQKTPYYQYYLLDVLAFTAVVSFLIIFGTMKIFLFLLCKSSKC